MFNKQPLELKSYLLKFINSSSCNCFQIKSEELLVLQDVVENIWDGLTVRSEDQELQDFVLKCPFSADFTSSQHLKQNIRYSVWLQNHFVILNGQHRKHFQIFQTLLENLLLSGVKCFCYSSSRSFNKGRWK